MFLHGVDHMPMVLRKVLADFSESAENQANVAGLIGNGITYDAWTG